MSEFKVLGYKDDMEVLSEPAMPYASKKSETDVLLAKAVSLLEQLTKKDTVVNVDVPKQTIPAPVVNIDIPKTFKLDSDQAKELSKPTTIVQPARGGGGGGGGAEFIKNVPGDVINPATSEKQDTTNSLLTTGAAIKTGDSFSIDPFGRWRVSETETLFDSKQLFDAQPLFYDDQEISGGGTASSHSTALAQTTMSVSASTAGRRVRQTFMRFNYQPGKGQLILCTGVLNLSGGGTGIRQAFGYFDDKNGIFLQYNDGVAQIVKRSYATGSAVDTAVNQSSWNVDKFDGNGPSGYTLDFTKSQIFWIDFEWLGVGRVRTGFVINGVIYYAHQFVHANNTNVVYMSTPNLPVRYEIENDGTGGAATLGHICTSIMSEGGLQENGAIFTADNGTTHVDANTADTTYALVGIRIKSTHLGATVKLLNFSAMAETATAFRWAIYFNPTVAGTFTFSDIAHSACQSAVGATANTVTGGTLITSGYVPGTSQQRGAATGELSNALRLGSTIAGVSDTIVLCCTPLTANADIFGGLTWRELL